MIPAAFDYVRVDSVDEAVAALVEHGDDAHLLAGGHSLLPLMKLRLATPAVLIDIARIEELRGVREDGDHLVIGATTRHQEVIDDPLIARHCGALAHVTGVIGDAQVRHRGTFGGALTHADPAGDLPAAALALEATFVAQGPGGRREIAAADFFLDYLTTALEPDELLVEVRVPKLDDSWGWHYEKFRRVAQAWAIVGVLGLVSRANGGIAEARVGLTHMDSVPRRATAVEEALRGATLEAIDDASASAAEGTRPPTDLNASVEYREHLARVLTGRALRAAAAV